MGLHCGFKERVIALVPLALMCLAPVFVGAKIPARFPESQAVQDPIEATSSAQASAQDSQPGMQQDPNSQPQPLATERSVSKPPQIAYKEGQLTIIAENSALSEVMSALRAVMGADVDLPASVAHQRIWVRLGPGPARRILRDLLDNTELDYVIQASDIDPEGIKSVLLTLRSKSGEASVPGSRVARGTSRKNVPQSSNPVEAPEQDASTAVESAAVSDTAPAGSPSTSSDAPSAASRVQPVPGVSGPSLSKPGAGTSEQMIQQLQGMYQQRRQMQAQQNQKPPSNIN